MLWQRSTPHQAHHLRMAAMAAYFIAGFTISAWAPLIPYAKMRADLSEGALGTLLLCLGLGSVLIMPLTGMLTNKYGCRRIAIIFALLGSITLPLLATFNSPTALGLTLLFFGGAAGGLDVVSAIQSVMIQKTTKRQIMSQMLACYSIGCIAGPALMSLLLHFALSPVAAALCASASILILLFFFFGDLSPAESTEKKEREPFFTPPKGIVLLLASMCFVVFLVEGAIMDWGALFLVDYKEFTATHAGIGFAVFSAAIAIARLMGAWLIRIVGGEHRMMLLGCLVSCCGFVLTLFFLHGKVALLGFFLIGLGNANIIPLLFAAAGRQTVMETSMAVSAVSTLGYSGILVGPAFIGFVAHFTGLFFIFILLGIFMLAVALLSRHAAHIKST